MTDFDAVSRVCSGKPDANEPDTLEDVGCRDENEEVDG